MEEFMRSFKSLRNVDLYLETVSTSLIFQDDLCLYLANEKYPVPSSYLKLFLRKYFDLLLLRNSEIHEKLLELYLNVENRVYIGHRTFYLDTYLVITVQQSDSLISGGNTGLSVWDSSIEQSKFILRNTEQFMKKKILELGSGLGLAGMTACFYSENVTLTDMNPIVLNFLRNNLLINELNGKVEEFDWDFPSETILDTEWDILLGSDLLYSENVVNSLLEIIRKLKFEVFIISFVVRRDDTVKLFFDGLESCDIQATFIYEDNKVQTWKLTK